MAFELPVFLQEYLNTKPNLPCTGFNDVSQFYANLDYYFINYMTKVVKPCVEFATATHGGNLTANIGRTIVTQATKLIKGDKILFNGDDTACQFLSDVWVPSAGFDNTLEQVINYMLTGGTQALKLNMDKMGRCRLSASRVDRYICTTNDCGDVVEALFFVTLISTIKSTDNKSNTQYWLVERRYYKEGEPFVEYIVHTKSGVAGSEILPFIFDGGVPYENLSDVAKHTVDAQGIKLNEPLKLPFRDGLGVWVTPATATNSVVPGIAMGDPLLYGCLDMLWAIDTVFCGSMIDVLNGKGVVLVPKYFLNTLNKELEKIGYKRGAYFSSDFDSSNDSIVHVTVREDKDFKPEVVQFDIRSQAYKEMWELILRQVVVAAGYTPTSIFPFLQDTSARTATEVTAEENLTRASVQSIHRLLIPKLNKAFAEILYQEGFKGQASIQLSDYIGNKILRDENTRANYFARLIPQEVAVQQINGISNAETHEYIKKIKADIEASAFGNAPFNDKDYFGEAEIT